VSSSVEELPWAVIETRALGLEAVVVVVVVDDSDV